MEKKKCYTQEESLLLLLDKFIFQLRRSDMNEYQITKKIYLFCVGYYLKYESNLKRYGVDDIDVILSILTQAITRSGSYVYSRLDNHADITYFYKFVVQYVVSEVHEARDTFLEFRTRNEKRQLELGVIVNNKRRGGRRF